MTTTRYVLIPVFEDFATDEDQDRVNFVVNDTLFDDIKDPLFIASTLCRGHGVRRIDVTEVTDNETGDYYGRAIGVMVTN